MPKVDVIIPAYNAAKYLPLAIESVMAQTFEDWRIVLVDDGSTDNTAEVVAPYIDRLGPKLTYIRQANAKMSAARNTAIRSSSSEFLAMLDADDVWLPSRLMRSLECFEGRPEVGLSYGVISLIDTEGAVIQTFPRRQRHEEGKIARYLYTRETNMCCVSVTIRRKCVEEVGGFDETLQATEDRDLWLRIALQYDVAFVPEVIAYYRTSSNSMSANVDRMLKAQLRFVEKHYGAPGCGFLARQAALGLIYKEHAELRGRRGELGAALMSLIRSSAVYPLDMSNARIAGSLLLRHTGLNR